MNIRYSIQRVDNGYIVNQYIIVDDDIYRETLYQTRTYIQAEKILNFLKANLKFLYN